VSQVVSMGRLRFAVPILRCLSALIRRLGLDRVGLIIGVLMGSSYDLMTVMIFYDS
jgi:hypothetical protein